MWMSLPLFPSTFLKTSSIRGLQEFSPGNSIENSPTHTSTHRLVRFIAHRLSPPLIPDFLGPSESEIRNRLTLEEEMEDLASIAIDSDDKFTMTKYISFGLELEERQYVFFRHASTL